LASFLQDGRLLIFGLLIVLGSIFYPQGMITPELLENLKKLFKSIKFQR
jgi:branched-chain amino acid transport system permease protein